MKLLVKSFPIALAGVALTLDPTAGLTQVTSTRSVAFGCRTEGNGTILFGPSPDGETDYFDFKPEYSAYFKDYNAEQICKETVAKLQNRHNQNQLKFVASGVVEGQPVACFVDTNNNKCNSNDDKLFSFNPATVENPTCTLHQLYSENLKQGDRSSCATNDGSGSVLPIFLSFFP